MPLGIMILIDKFICELWETNMASEHVSFLDVVPLKSGDVVKLPECAEADRSRQVMYEDQR